VPPAYKIPVVDKLFYVIAWKSRANIMPVIWSPAIRMGNTHRPARAGLLPKVPTALEPNEGLKRAPLHLLRQRGTESSGGVQLITD